MNPTSERVTTNGPPAVRYGPRSPLIADTSDAPASDTTVTDDETPASNGPPALRGDALARELQRVTHG